MDLKFPDWGKKNFPLTRPFDLAGVTYSSIDFRVPNGNDLIKFASSPGTPYAQRVLALASDLSQLDENVFRAMYGPDYAGAAQVVADFLDPAPATLTTSAQTSPASFTGT